MAWISFGALPCKEKKTWWQLASRCCWNRARPWHASEIFSFLIRLRTYQHPGSAHLESVSTSQFDTSPQEYFLFLVAFLKATVNFPMSTVRPSVHMEQLGLLDGFSWNFVLVYFKDNLSRKFHWSLTGITGYLRENIYINNNNNNNNKLQLCCHPVAVVILHVNKTWNWLLLNLSREGYMRSM